MKWFEVVTGCDGYCTPSRFRTEQEAQDYADRIEKKVEMFMSVKVRTK